MWQLHVLLPFWFPPPPRHSSVRLTFWYSLPGRPPLAAGLSWAPLLLAL